MRLELTKRTDLALRLLVSLEAQGERVKAVDLAVDIGTSPGYLPQVAAPLAKRGWIHSEPGPSGGYIVDPSASEISVLQLIEAVEGPTQSDQCVLVDGPCSSDAPCALHGPWSRARSLLIEELDRSRVLEMDLLDIRRKP